MEHVARDDFRPDLRLVFAVRVEGGQQRLAAGRRPGEFERPPVDFLDRVRATYLARAAAEPQRCRVVDSTQPLAKVRDQLAAIFAKP